SRPTSALRSSARSLRTTCGASTSCSTRRPIAAPARYPWPSSAARRVAPDSSPGRDGPALVRITFLCPHVRIAGGVRAILTYADRLGGRGHRVTVLVPAHGRLRALGRRLRGVRPDWLPSFRARIEWVTRWSPEWLPPGEEIVATAWLSERRDAAAAGEAGRHVDRV